jgi:hypothetical protein
MKRWGNMKVRTGFVSNSSSSSFCIYKKLMTEEQIVVFRQLLEAKSDNWYETCIGETDTYFIGRLDQHDDRVYNFIKKNFKPGDYADYC